MRWVRALADLNTQECAEQLGFLERGHRATGDGYSEGGSWDGFREGRAWLS